MKTLNTIGLLVFAVIGSGAVGGAAFSLQLAMMVGLTDGIAGLAFGLFTLIFAVPAFMIAAALLGPLIWLGVRKTRLNRPVPAALIGAGIALITGVPLLMGWTAVEATMEGRIYAIAFFIAGGAGGWVFQRMMAESSSKPRPARPS